MRSGFSPAQRLPDTGVALALRHDGLVFGHGTQLIRFADGGERLALDADRDRCLAMLSVVAGRPVTRESFRSIEAAAMYWQQGERALANLRLVFAGLPKLRDPADAARLRAAEYLLDNGMAPGALMEELGLDASALDLGKYDPDQPRVPAGSGRESGRWTGDADTGNASATKPTFRQTPKLVQVAANGPFHPAGVNVVPVPPGDTLDPQGLNKPLSFAEQQAIADTFNTILLGRPDDIPALDPHAYNNWRSDLTGAVLPDPIGKYTTYRVPSTADEPDVARLILDKGGHIYYTNNHYLSFYPIDLKIQPE